MRGLAALSALILALAPLALRAEAPEPMVAVPGYEKQALLGEWFLVATTPWFLKADCHGTTVGITSREDSRLEFKLACPVGSVTGKIVPVDGILAETAPGEFVLRFVRLAEIGGITLVVLWQAEDDSMAVIGATDGRVGWVWSKTAHPDPKALEAAKAILAKHGYNPRYIADVEQGK